MKRISFIGLVALCVATSLNVRAAQTTLDELTTVTGALNETIQDPNHNPTAKWVAYYLWKSALKLKECTVAFAKELPEHFGLPKQCQQYRLLVQGGWEAMLAVHTEGTKNDPQILAKYLETRALVLPLIGGEAQERAAVLRIWKQRGGLYSESSAYPYIEPYRSHPTLLPGETYEIGASGLWVYKGQNKFGRPTCGQQECPIGSDCCKP